MKVLSINNNINKQNIMFANNANTTLPANSLNIQATDSFEREDKKLSTNAKIGIGIGIGLAVIGATAIYFLTRGRGKVKGSSETSSLTPPKNNNKGNPLEHNSNPEPLTSNSIIPHKEFSLNPKDQVDEKYHYIHYEVLPLIEKSPEAYYEGLQEFEKYGTRIGFQGMEYHTLQHIGMTFPEAPSPKVVNKFMDIFEKFGEGLHLNSDGLINLGDGNNYMTHISQKGVITSVEQLRKALEKGKKIIWSNDGINELRDTLTYGNNAPFKGNKEVEEILEQFYETAFNNRTPFKDDFDIQSYEKIWGITRN